MNILNFLIKEKRIAGVEIGDQFIRVAYFRPRKRFSKKIHSAQRGPTEHELVLIEEPLPANIILEGVVVDKEALGKVLRDIWTREKLNANYAIVAIPENKIYSHIFPFPKTSEPQLEEAVNLAIDFQFPVKKSDMYIDWENAGDSNVINEVRISAISKTIADNYISALGYAGIKILALESHLASIARSIKVQLGQATLFIKRSSNEATIFITKDGIVCFSRVIPQILIKNDNFLLEESERVKTFFESERKIPVVLLPLEKAVVRDEYLEYLELNGVNLELQSEWLVALGAAIRGEIPKGQDNRISLLPIGTAQAYAYQRTTTFIGFIRNMTIGVSIFFLFAFLASYLFIFSISQTIGKASSNFLITPTSPDIIQKQELIKRTNLMTQTSAIILSTTPNWSILLEEINSRIIPGVLVTNFSATSVIDQMSITGIAKDRNTLNELKKSLQNSLYLTEVGLPITNLEQKGDIPFLISFRLKDPGMLYYK